MPAPPRPTEHAVRETASVQQAREAAGAVLEGDLAAVAASAGPGSADPLLGELRRGGLLPLLVLHLLRRDPSYGNQLMERIAGLTGGLLAVNPNTMYPLLRSLERRGLLVGQWEHPERRSRRFYRITAPGAVEHERLLQALGPRLEQVAQCVALLRRELRSPPAGGDR